MLNDQYRHYSVYIWTRFADYDMYGNIVDWYPEHQMIIKHRTKQEAISTVKVHCSRWWCCGCMVYDELTYQTKFFKGRNYANRQR